MRAAKVQASLCIRAVSPEPSLLAHTSSESRGTFRQKARSLAPLNGWACAVKICNDGMLENTNSLDGAHMLLHVCSYDQFNATIYLGRMRICFLLSKSNKMISQSNAFANIMRHLIGCQILQQYILRFTVGNPTPLRYVIFHLVMSDLTFLTVLPCFWKIVQFEIRLCEEVH